MYTRYDPTRTTTLQNKYKADMKRRFFAVRSNVTKAIWKQDALGLNESEPFTFNNLVSNAIPERQAWRFLTDAQKLTAFQGWIQEQINQEILTVGVTGNPWTAEYVGSAYRTGVVRAYNDTRRTVALDNIDFYNGGRSEFLESSFTHGERMSKLQFLYTRSFEELRGITSIMSQQMNRILANGIANGQGAATIARELSNNITLITRQRAMVLARTELIAAHAEGQLDSFEALGVEEVGIMAEWSTAGDDLVCPLCEPLDGAIMTVKEARGIIPRHPNCRCAWIPASAGKKNKSRNKTKTPKQIDKSLKAELPEKTRAGEEVPQTIDEAKDRSTWAGKELLSNKRCHHLITNEKWFNDYMDAIRNHSN